MQVQTVIGKQTVQEEGGQNNASRVNSISLLFS
jgi:hypothetical protein